MVIGKQKGNSFEGKIWKDLKKIFEYSHRTIGSGTVKEDKGDINFREYLVECKHYKKVTQTMIDDWWKKICSESKKENKYPLLIYRENYQPVKVVCTIDNVRVTIIYEEWLIYVANKFKSA